MFKKTLLALAIAGTAFNAAATLTLDAGGAGALTTNDLLISVEGSANTTSVALDAVTATISGTVTGYTTAEKIRVTITGGTLTPSTSLTVVHTDGDAATGGTITYPSLSQAVLTMAGAGQGFVTGTVATDTLVIDGLVIAPTSTSAGSTIGYTIEVLSSVGGSVIDTITGVVATYKTQYSASTTGTVLGTDEIDVGDGRLSFVTDDLTDALGIKVSSALVDLMGADASASKAEYTITGSLGFLDGDSSGAVDTGTIAASAGTLVVAADFASASGVATAVLTGGFDGAAADTETNTVTITVDGETHVLAPQTFTAATEFDYLDQGGKTGTFSAALSGGAWTLNGDSAYIPFMPFADAFAQSITVTNSGPVAGTITVDITANGETNSHTLTAVAGAEMVTNITGEIRAFAKADGVTGNAAINVVTNSPSADITVSALYYSKADADRGIVSVVNN